MRVVKGGTLSMKWRQCAQTEGQYATHEIETVPRHRRLGVSIVQKRKFLVWEFHLQICSPVVSDK